MALSQQQRRHAISIIDLAKLLIETHRLSLIGRVLQCGFFCLSMFLACRACWVLIGRLTALFAYHHHCPLVDDWIGTSCCHVSESSLNCPWLHRSLRTIVRIYDVGSMACNFHNPTHTFSQDKITSSIINSHATPFDGPHSTQSSTTTQH